MGLHATFRGCLSSALVVIVTLQACIGDLETVEGLEDLLVLSSLKSNLGVDILKLVLDDLDIVVLGTQVVLKLGALGLLARLGELQLANLLLEALDGLALRADLILQHLVRLPTSILQKLDDLKRTQKPGAESDLRNTYVGSITL